MKENELLRKQVTQMSNQMRSLEQKFDSLSTSLLAQMAELRQENRDLKTYVRSKLSQPSSGPSASATSANRKKTGDLSLTRKSGPEGQKHSSKRGTSGYRPDHQASGSKSNKTTTSHSVGAQGKHQSSSNAHGSKSNYGGQQYGQQNQQAAG